MSFAVVLRRNAVRWLALGAGCAIVAGAIVRFLAVDPMRRVQGEHRFIEARVGGFEFATFRVLRSGEQPGSEPASRAMEELLALLGQDRSVENLRRAGDGWLALGNERAARPLLEEAVRRRPADPLTLADLAAVELASGLVADAAEHAGRAVSIDPRQPSAAFNWALGLEKLADREGAIAAWQEYLRIDPGGGWSAEAQQHLAALRAPRPSYEGERNLLSAGTDRGTIERLTRRYPQRARSRGHNVLLLQWVESGRAGVLDALRVIAETRAEGGDPYLLDITSQAGGHRSEIAAGVRAYADARTSEKAGDWDTASRRFSDAAELLRRAGSPLALGADVYAASAEMSGAHTERAMERVASIESRLAASGDRYPAVAAETAWIRGVIQARAGATSDALRAYRHALDEARRSGEREHEAAIGELVASRLAAAGEHEEADRLRLQVLRQFDEIGADLPRLYVAYEEMAFTSQRDARPHVALAFADAAARLAAKSGDALQKAESSERRALALHDLGRQEEAIGAINVARAHAMGVITAGTRDRVLSEIDYTTGRIEMGHRPDRAVAAFSSALDIWKRYGWRNHTANGLLARGNAALASGDKAAAERDFRAGIDEVEQQRVGIIEPVLRVAYFERSDVLFDRLIALLLDEGRSADALSVLERARARFLLDQIRGTATSAQPLDAAAIAGGVERGAAVIELMLTDRGAGIWLVHEGRVTFARSAATREAIMGSAAHYLEAVTLGNETEMTRVGRWLFAQLIGPVSEGLPAGADLIIVPGAELQSFPFATLIVPDGRYLIERQPVVISPSASVALGVARASTRDTLIAVAQPAPEGFKVLPAAEREAKEIARSHPHGQFASGDSMPPQEFLDSAARAGVVHFSGHATTDEGKPFDSSLVFESRIGAAEHLTAERVAQSTLTSHPLVVLAACGTGRGRLHKNEGVDSLAAAFLEAGARGVAATLWDIDDAPSSKLFRTFHENLRAGQRACDAIRNAQIAFIHSADSRNHPPEIWGSVTLIGRP